MPTSDCLQPPENQSPVRRDGLRVRDTQYYTGIGAEKSLCFVHLWYEGNCPFLPLRPPYCRGKQFIYQSWAEKGSSFHGSAHAGQRDHLKRCFTFSMGSNGQRIPRIHPRRAAESPETPLHVLYGQQWAAGGERQRTEQQAKSEKSDFFHLSSLQYEKNRV